MGLSVAVGATETKALTPLPLSIFSAPITHCAQVSPSKSTNRTLSRPSQHRSLNLLYSFKSISTHSISPIPAPTPLPPSFHYHPHLFSRLRHIISRINKLPSLFVTSFHHEILPHPSFLFFPPLFHLISSFSSSSSFLLLLFFIFFPPTFLLHLLFPSFVHLLLFYYLFILFFFLSYLFHFFFFLFFSYFFSFFL